MKRLCKSSTIISLQKSQFFVSSSLWSWKSCLSIFRGFLRALIFNFEAFNQRNLFLSESNHRFPSSSLLIRKTPQSFIIFVFWSLELIHGTSRTLEETTKNRLKSNTIILHYFRHKLILWFVKASQFLNVCCLGRRIISCNKLAIPNVVYELFLSVFHEYDVLFLPDPNFANSRAGALGRPA